MNIQKFEIFKNVSNKRTPTVKPIVVTPPMKNSNNAAVLADYNIQYDNPMTCEEVAQHRLDRLNKEKMKQVVCILELTLYIDKNIIAIKMLY